MKLFKHSRPAIVSTLGLLLLGCCFIPRASWALGISPANLEYQQIKTNSIIHGQLLVSGTNSVTTDTLNITATGEAAGAIELPVNQITLAPQTTTPINYSINTAGLEPGNYTADLSIVQAISEKKVEDNTSAVQTGATVHVQFSVTTEDIHQLSIDGVELRTTEQPITLQYRLINGGNVSDRPLSATLAIQNLSTHESRLLTIDDLSWVDPFNSISANIQLPSNLSGGNYAISVQFTSNDGETLYTSSEQHFQIPLTWYETITRASTAHPVTGFMITLGCLLISGAGFWLYQKRARSTSTKSAKHSA